MRMEERNCLDIVKANRQTYKIVVDNDSIWVEDILNNVTIFEFRNYGQEFIIELLNELGYNAEGC